MRLFLTNVRLRTMELASYKQNFQKAVEHFKGELAGLRCGRASPALIENILVDAYNSKMSIKGLASIAIPDAKTIVVEPWDKSIIKNIEAAISQAGLGLNPVNDGRVLRLIIPPLTEESRRELVKVVGQKLEVARISVRQTREQIKEKIVNAEKNKEIGEDERFRLQDSLDKMVSDYNAEIKKIGEEKEKEIMTI